MPYMKYKCDSCGYERTLFQRWDADDLLHCPMCSNQVIGLEVDGPEPSAGERYESGEDYRPPLL